MENSEHYGLSLFTRHQRRQSSKNLKTHKNRARNSRLQAGIKRENLRKPKKQYEGKSRKATIEPSAKGEIVASKPLSWLEAVLSQTTSTVSNSVGNILSIFTPTATAATGTYKGRFVFEQSTLVMHFYLHPGSQSELLQQTKTA